MMQKYKGTLREVVKKTVFYGQGGGCNPVTRVSNGCAEVYSELGLYKPSSLLRPYIANTSALLTLELSLMPVVNHNWGVFS